MLTGKALLGNRERVPPCTLCVCLCVHKSPWQEVSRKWRDFHSSVYFYISAKNIWLHSKQMNKGGISYAAKREIRNVNIMYRTNIFVCGLLFKGMVMYANITAFRTFGRWLCAWVVKTLSTCRTTTTENKIWCPLVKEPYCQPFSVWIGIGCNVYTLRNSSLSATWIIWVD